MARCPSVSFPLEAAAISPQPCSLCFSCSPWTFRSIPCAHHHSSVLPSLAVLQAEVRCSPPPPAVWGCTAGRAPPHSPQCPQPCPHSTAVPLLLALTSICSQSSLWQGAAVCSPWPQPCCWGPVRAPGTLKGRRRRGEGNDHSTSWFYPPPSFLPTRKETQKHHLLQDRAASVLRSRTPASSTTGTPLPYRPPPRAAAHCRCPHSTFTPPSTQFPKW